MASIPLIFGPGLMCDDALFAEQVSHFSESRDVGVADFTPHSTIGGMAKGVLDAAPKRFSFVGLSMGGIVGFELYRQAPERIASLVLMNTTPDLDTAEKAANRLRQIERARAGDLEAMVLEELKPNYLSEQSRKDLALLSEINAMATRLGEDVFERQSMALLRRNDSRALLSKIECPVALVTGEQDVLCPPGLHEKMHQAINESALHVLPECGHLSTMERPNSVNAILRELLDRLDKQPENA